MGSWYHRACGYIPVIIPHMRRLRRLRSSRFGSARADLAPLKPGSAPLESGSLRLVLTRRERADCALRRQFAQFAHSRRRCRGHEPGAPALGGRWIRAERFELR
ncbi:hypothetical protein GCM10022240_18460 [Microbacterium kribbense]|uniref:Uncharacterized protein n=1 Tax=Microbacterium kribbense TaxID=433645 RepID=A0ABP7GPP5_9MICO